MIEYWRKLSLIKQFLNWFCKNQSFAKDIEVLFLFSAVGSKVLVKWFVLPNWKTNEMPSILAQNRPRVKYIIVKFQNTRDKEKIPEKL